MRRARSGGPLRALLAAAACVALLACALAARAATLEVYSQNTLHLGWGKPVYQTNKNDYIKNKLVATASYDVALLQEVMPKLGGLSTIWPNSPVGKYYVNESKAFGKSSYRETYGVLVNNRLGNVVLPVSGSTMTCSTSNAISRPPCGVLLKIGLVGTWFLDYHAMFGSVANRKAEVGKIGAVVQAFQQTSVSGTKYARVVVGGDWNFPKADLAKILALGGTTLAPDTETSLNPKGVLSSRYDHFWCTAGMTCSGATAITAPPAPYSTLPSYRTNVSDHVAVKITVAY